MDLGDVALFVETLRAGSISDAARRLSLTQPTASRRIRRLELDLGQELLSRSGRSVTPTRAGLSLLQFAEATLAHERQLREMLQSPHSLHGSLHIAASTAPGESFVPGLLAAFAGHHDGLSAQLAIMDSQAVERCVADGTCDVGFTGHPPARGLLSAQEIGRDELVLAVPRSHPAFAEAEVSPEDLLRQTFVERSPGSGTRRTIEERLSSTGLHYAERRIALTVNSAQAVLAAVRSGIGVGFVSRLVLRGEPKDEVRGLRIRGLRIERPLYVVWDAHPSAAAEAFVAFVRSARAVRADG
ncbi:MAG: LysR family transcriptional regulator [Thermaerobacter sp.]|nr:LysR family transcriptional regulator [Thermaerobacter sp.]